MAESVFFQCGHHRGMLRRMVCFGTSGCALSFDVRQLLLPRRCLSSTELAYGSWVRHVWLQEVPLHAAQTPKLAGLVSGSTEINPVWEVRFERAELSSNSKMVAKSGGLPLVLAGMENGCLSLMGADGSGINLIQEYSAINSFDLDASSGQVRLTGMEGVRTDQLPPFVCVRVRDSSVGIGERILSTSVPLQTLQVRQLLLEFSFWLE